MTLKAANGNAKGGKRERKRRQTGTQKAVFCDAKHGLLIMY